MNLKKISTAILSMTICAATLLSGCSKSAMDTSAALISVDGAKVIDLGYANFAAKYLQACYDPFYTMYYGESVWSTDMYGDGNTMQDSVKDYVLSMLQEDYVCGLHAEEYGVTLSDEDHAKIEAAADKFIADNSKEAFQAMGATKEYVVKFLENSTITARVNKAITDAADVVVTKDEAWQKTMTYAFFSVTTATDADGNVIDVTDEYVASQKAAAEKLASAEDFDAAAETSGASVSTYSFTKGEQTDTRFDMAVISAADALKEGEVSSVIEVADDGFYVVRLDQEYDAAATDSMMSSLTDTKKNEAYMELVGQWEDAIDWSIDQEQWALVVFNTIFDAKDTVEEAE